MNIVGVKKGPSEVITLTLVLADGADSGKVSWTGATPVAGNPLQATVPADQAVRQRVAVRYDDTDCREIFVWPVWVEVTIRTTGNLSPDNVASLIKNGNWPNTVAHP